jgi:hypothetical protein
MHPECPQLTRFLRGEIDPAHFPHREHVRIAFEMLRRLDFAESVWQFSKTLRLMAIKAGRPRAFNQTITIAFLGLIAERMESDQCGDFSAFEREHAELFDKNALARWYPAARLATAAARRIFLLPQLPLPEPTERPVSPSLNDC